MEAVTSQLTNHQQSDRAEVEKRRKGAGTDWGEPPPDEGEGDDGAEHEGQESHIPEAPGLPPRGAPGLHLLSAFSSWPIPLSAREPAAESVVVAKAFR